MGLGIMCWGHARDILTTGLFSNMGSSCRFAFLSSANTTLLLSQFLNRHLI